MNIAAKTATLAAKAPAIFERFCVNKATDAGGDLKCFSPEFEVLAARAGCHLRLRIRR
jgi:hypothetical protein